MYMRLAPRNLEYDKYQKTYRATAKFRPAVGRDDAQLFLSQLAALSIGTPMPSASLLRWRPPFEIARVPVRPIAARTLRHVLWAIRDAEELKVLYQSMRRPAPTSRWIAPHALAFDGLRWHVRAWCHENADFRDFVISRIQRVQGSRETAVKPATDTWWHTFVDIIVRPRAELTAAQRIGVEADLGMTSGRLTINCRKALAFYLLRELRLERPSHDPPAVQPLELVNRDDFSEVIAAAQKNPEGGSASDATRTEHGHE